MGTLKCCCNCTIATDDFNRADADDLGPRWTEPVVDEWGIASDMAYMDAEESIAIFNPPHPVPDGSGVAYYTIVNEVDDAIYYILVSVVDELNYYQAEFHNTATPKIVLARVSGGSRTVLAEENITGLVASEFREFNAKIAPGEFCAGVNNAVESLVTIDADPNEFGYYSGMGGYNESEDPLVYDDFVFSQHLHTRANCPFCICECDETYIPHKLIASLSGTGRMAGLDCDIELEYDRVNSRWIGSDTCCDQPWVITLTCTSEEADITDKFVLSVTTGCTDSDTTDTGDEYLGPGSRKPDPEESTCEPIYLLFGPFNVSSTDLTCQCGDPLTISGQYIIEVTAA